MWLDGTVHREVVTTFQLGYLEPRRRRWTGRRTLPRLPLLQIVVEPGESIDFADPVTGFQGYTRPPPRRRVLRLWADDLMSVSHGDDWTFVVGSDHSFGSRWLDLLVPPRRTAGPLRFAVVSASFAGPTPAGRFHVAELDATTYTSLVRIEDHRG